MQFARCVEAGADSAMLKTTRPHSWPIAVPARLAWLVALSALLGGCTGSDWQPPRVMLATAMGATTIYTPAAARPADDVLPAPPAGLANAASAAGTPAGHDGNYAGWADPFVTDGGLCRQTLRIEGFHVLGDQVSFGQFRGRIDSGNGVQMAGGSDWLIGQFYGVTFHGQLMTYAAHNRPACSFIVRLERVAG
jgi:hypothetical protein